MGEQSAAVLVGVMDFPGRHLCYAPPTSSVELRVNDLIGKVQITVRDHGPGVPADMLQRIFDPLSE